MRRLTSLSMLAALALAGGGVATAATPISQTGTIGDYAVTDTPANPGARCRYDSGAGSHYLGSIRARGIAMWGLHDELQEVGYRVMLQQRKPSGWTTIAQGPLKTALVEQDVPNGLDPSSVARDPDIAPNDARYRAALKLLWFDPDDGSVEGRILLRIDHHRRSFDGSVGAQCRGQVPTGIGG